MTNTAIILITISVFAHAGWNLLSKHRPSLAFFLVAEATSMLILLPVLWYNRPLLAWVPVQAWWLVLASGFFHASYFTLLAGAYRHGDMSLAYPMLRALPVLMITGIGLMMGHGDKFTPWSLLGMFAIVAGCLLLPIKHFSDIRLRDYLALCCLLSVAAAMGTTGYTMTDDGAFRLIRSGLPWLHPSHRTVFYVTLQTYSAGLWIMLLVLLQPKEWKRLQHLWQENRWQVMATGPVITSAYGLVLASMAYVNHVSYVAAFRQLSIPLGALLGMMLLKEAHYWPKVIGIATVSAGLILVALF
jgi:drug/metabolite transporter (DMT)-like permease